MSLSTSLPQTSQPGGVCLANSSIRGRSPISDLIPDNIGFLAVFLHRGQHHLMNACGFPPWPSLGRQDAQLHIGPCPVAHTPKQGVGLFVLLYPGKGHGLIGEAPRLYDAQCVQQHGKGYPEEQGAVPVGQLPNRQGPDVLNAHGGIVAFSGAASPFLGVHLVLPGWVSVDNAVFFDSLSSLRQWAANTALAMLPVLNRQKHSSTV